MLMLSSRSNIAVSEEDAGHAEPMPAIAVPALHVYRGCMFTNIPATACYYVLCLLPDDKP